MHVSIFDHELKQVSIGSETSAPLDNSDPEFLHYFGGEPAAYGITFANVEIPCHAVFVLDTADPLVPCPIAGMRHLPLVHGFSYSSNGFEFIYRFVSDKEIEVLAPENLNHNPNFPYKNYPPAFPQTRIQFQRESLDNFQVNSALEYQGVFQLDHLSPQEMEQAVKIAKETWHAEVFERDETTKDWTDAQIVRNFGRSPFMQDAPSDRCDNPNCTVEIDSEFDGMVFRKPSLKVIAMHESKTDLMWGMSHVQLIFQFCEACHCITVTNQCT